MGIYPFFKPLESRQDTEVIMEGKRRVMLGSNNYLGLTVHPDIVEIGAQTIKKLGTGCSGSRFLNGTLNIHLELEYVIIDRENHASLYDGCRLSFGQMLRYRHNDMKDLESKLSMVPETVGRYISKVATRKNVKPVYTIGLMYQAACILTRILPHRVLNFIIGKLYA